MKISPAMVVLILAALAGCGHPRSSECLSGRREALIEGNFTGPIICSGEDASFVRIGQVDDYVLYDYRYRFLPEDGAVMHGGQRVIVFRREKYAGQYALSPPPYATVSVKGAQVLFQTEGHPGVSAMDFSNGPPPQIFSGGYSADLFH